MNLYKQVGRFQGNKDKQYIRAKEERRGWRGRERRNMYIQMYTRKQGQTVHRSKGRERKGVEREI